MRASLLLQALCFAGTSALDLGRLRQFSEMAEQGLYPDGTPMRSETEPTVQVLIAPPTPEVIVPEYVELPLNHWGKKKPNGKYIDGTYFNRFWVSTDVYKPGAPVFLYDVGEADGEAYVASRLGRNATGGTTNMFRQMVDKYQGVGIVWEHRYYGNSTPGNVPITVDTKAEVFKWLNTEQSLKDIVLFAEQFTRPNINYTLTPKKTPWIMVGGSYPAMRTAFMRDQYPETIFAGFASSAPTEARIDMSVYFEPIARGMERYGAGNCSKDIHAAINYIDKQLSNAKVGAALKQQFLGAGAEKNTHATFADALTSVFWFWQSYGMDGSPWNLGQLCDWIETDPVTEKVAGKDGWAKSKGAKFVVDRWASWEPFTGAVNDFFTTTCSGKANVTAECNLDLPFTDPSTVSWTWQYCTQWGFFQSANLGPNQIVSRYNSLEHQRDICHRQWPTAKAPLFPDLPRTDLTNHRFGGWDIRPSQLYWSGGEFDPWRTLSPLSGEPWAPHPRAFTEPPRCGEGQDEDEIFGYVLKNAQHCYDFRTTVALGETSRGIFYKALDRWLKCFRPKGQ